MIKMMMTGPDGERLLVLGVTDENVKRLRAGEPVFIRAAALNAVQKELSEQPLSHDILIMHGATHKDLFAILKEHLGPVMTDAPVHIMGRGPEDQL